MTPNEIDEMADWYANEERVARAVARRDQAARHQDAVDDSMTRCVREANRLDWLLTALLCVLSAHAALLISELLS